LPPKRIWRARSEPLIHARKGSAALSALDPSAHFLAVNAGAIVGRHTVEGPEFTSVDLDGGAVKVLGPVGPFEHDFQMWMDASPRDEIVFTICRESPHELWSARLR
jgi:hypothetical protein